MVIGQDDDRVRAQYEAYPYPERDPADEAKRLIVGSPGHLLEINHYVFGGRLDVSRPLRALIAGGGTGDATIMLAQQLAWRGSPAEIVYLDVSGASLEVARARAAARNLANVRFLRGSLFDLPGLGLGRFDYIDCCGVLHCLPDPPAGLGALAAALAEGGGVGVMLYGKLGRTGVYHMQAMLRLIAGDDDDRTRLGLARRLYDDLPETSWLKRNPYVSDHLEGGDAGLYDIFLHRRDRAYTVPEIAAMVAGAGLEITGFVAPALYDPASYLADPEIKERALALPWIERCAFAELLSGALKSHVFYAVKSGHRKAAVAGPDNPEAVPVLLETDGRAAARGLQKGGRIKAEIEGVELSYEVPRLSAEILARIDGRRSLGQIHELLARAHKARAHKARAHKGALDWLVFKAAFDRLYAALNGINVMLITYPPR
ncbi:MAG: class I SAM-dependent methyltransferase [Alphaproteobacteria bacterium]